MTPNEADLRRRLTEYRADQDARLRAVLAAFETDDAPSFLKALERAIDRNVVAPALRAIGRAQHAPGAAFRRAFIDFWIEDSSGIREAGKDAGLLPALWKLMPPYDGTSVTLWRGETAYNRRRRSYGMSWTSSEAVARRFAGDMRELSESGAVVLRTEAPAEAIICAPAIVNNRLEEEEFIVDRRRLGQVSVVAHLKGGDRPD